MLEFILKKKIDISKEEGSLHSLSHASMLKFLTPFKLALFKIIFFKQKFIINNIIFRCFRS